MENLREIYLTFDIDFTNYVENKYFDEFILFFNQVKKIRQYHKNFVATVFIRVDFQTKYIFGKEDFFLNNYHDEIKYLKSLGFKFGWHFHSHKFENGKWLIESNEKNYLNGIKRYSEIALHYELEICRMGWGFHTDKSIKLIDNLGFRIDSSAIPRPNYKWSNNLTDWSESSTSWYYPSKKNFRVQGLNNYKVLEVPITTSIIEHKNDTKKNVVRYINPAYEKKCFIDLFYKNKFLNKIVSITHPYEISEINHPSYNGILSFSIDNFLSNLNFLDSMGYEFKVL